MLRPSQLLLLYMWRRIHLNLWVKNFEKYNIYNINYLLEINSNEFIFILRTRNINNSREYYSRQRSEWLAALRMTEERLPNEAVWIMFRHARRWLALLRPYGLIHVCPRAASATNTHQGNNIHRTQYIDSASESSVFEIEWRFICIFASGAMSRWEKMTITTLQNLIY